MPDQHGYPTEQELQTIREWACDDLDGLMEYLLNVWHWPEWGIVRRDDGCWELHTGGWSGNEDIIRAMLDNQVWWAIHWESSRRGGHYVFGRISREGE